VGRASADVGRDPRHAGARGRQRLLGPGAAGVDRLARADDRGADGGGAQFDDVQPGAGAGADGRCDLGPLPRHPGLVRDQPASYGIFLAALLVVRPRPQEKASRAESRIRDSLRLLRERPELLAFLAIVAIVGFASDPVNTLSPAFAREFGHKDTWAGFIVGAFGAGAVTAALIVAGRVAGSRRRMAATLVVLGAGVIAFSLAPWLVLGFALVFVGGFGYLASNTAATTRLQLGVAESQRGRIMALWSLAFLGMRPFASLLDGLIARTWGVRVAGVVLATPVLLAGLTIALSAQRRLRGRPRRAAAT
jgi:predicted MFS family arabinose efflux permease